jgi:branched-chain amino acid transport system substrate-binding protein
MFRRFFPIVLATALVGLAACGSSSKSANSTTSSTSSGSAPTSSGSATTSSGGSSTTAGQLTGSTIVIGQDGIYSGTGAPQGPHDGQTAKAWAAWVNSHGGINGHPVKVITLDNGQSAATAVANVKQLVQQDHVIALVGGSDNGLESGYAPTLDAAQVPDIGADTDPQPIWTSNDMFFPTGLTLGTLLSSTVVIDSQYGKGTKVADLACTESPACAQLAHADGTALDKAGLDFTSVYLASSTTVDFTAQCESWKQAGVKVVDLVYGVVPAIPNDCAQQNYFPIFTSQGEPMANMLTTDVNLEAPLQAPPWFVDSPIWATYKAAMQAAGIANDEGEGSSDTWQAFTVFQQVAEKAIPAGGTPTSQMVLNGLWSVSNDNFGGIVPSPITYTRDKPTPDQPCFFVLAIKNHQYTAPNGVNALCASASS